MSPDPIDQGDARAPSDRTPVVTVVHAPACHFCLDAEAALEVIASTYAVRWRAVEVDSAEGRRLVAQHRPAMNPLVLLDGQFFSAGRLPRKKLVRLLKVAAPARASVPSGA